MNMPNPSELQRIAEEKLATAVGRVNNLGLSKGTREAALREVRALERELGVEAIGNINGQSAQEQQDAALVAKSSVITLQDLKDARRRVETLTPGEIGTIIIALGEYSANSAARAVMNKLLGR
jgi:hypothetical protein